MYNTSMRIVGNSFIAEDMMQEAFIDCFRKINQYDFKSTFGAWLKRIVVNKSIDHINRAGMVTEKLNELHEESREDDELNFPCGVEEIKEAMNGLAKQYKIIFSLYLIEGYDHEEIAEILRISSSTSRSQLSRAKLKVREEILKKEMKYDLG